MTPNDATHKDKDGDILKFENSKWYQWVASEWVYIRDSFDFYDMSFFGILPISLESEQKAGLMYSKERDNP